MTLVNARAAFEKAVTDAVADADDTVLMKYDNVAFTTPGKDQKVHFDDGQFWAIHDPKPRRSSGLLFRHDSVQRVCAQISWHCSAFSD